MLKKYGKYIFPALLVLVFLAVWPYLRWQMRGNTHPERYLTFRGEWDAALLKEAWPSLAAMPEAVERTLIGQLPDGMEITLRNTGDRLWADSPPRYLEVQLEGAWFIVPEVPRDYVTLGYDYHLEPGESKTVTFSEQGLENIWNWSQLPAGQYRLRWLGYMFPLEK